MATLLDSLLSLDHDARWLACHELALHVGRYYRRDGRDDLVQEATIAVYQAVGKCNPDKDPVPYLETVAYRAMARVCNEAKRQTHQQLIEDD